MKNQDDTMPLQPTLQNNVNEEIRNMVLGLRDDISKVRIQTGELISTKEQINAIDRLLRGHDGQRGMASRLDIIEQALENLIEVQIPALIETTKNSTKADLQVCQANRALEYERLRGEIELLRAEYKTHLDITGKEQAKEEKEETRFGGREWWRENTSGIIIAIITALLVLVASGVVQHLIDTVP